MTEKEKLIVEQQFDAFCKRVMRNATRDIQRKRNRLAKREILFSAMGEGELMRLKSYDDHVLDCKVKVHGFNVVISDEMLETAIRVLNKRARDVILISFWVSMTDQEIAEILYEPRRTVQYVKKNAVKKLRELLKNKTYYEQDKL